MTDSQTISVPPLTRGWRLKMALAHADMTAQEMGAELGVARQTITRWMNVEGVPIRPAYLKMWALRTGVPYEWLLDGSEGESTRRYVPATHALAAIPA